MPCREGDDVRFARTEKIQKVQPGVLARLANTQEDEVFFNSRRRGKTFDGTAKPSKRFDRVLGVVVVPRNTIVAQKGEQFVSLFFQPILPFRRGRAREPLLRNLFVKTGLRRPDACEGTCF